jgi:hypothetical protein
MEHMYKHVKFFGEVCETFKFYVFFTDDVKLKIFTQNLDDKAHVWCKTYPTYINNAWVTNFKNHLGENLFDFYKRFRGLVDHCSHHVLLRWVFLHNFYELLPWSPI